MIVRFDDICVNTNMDKVHEMSDYILSLDHRVMFCVSPMVSGHEGERVFPGIMRAYSDYKVFYRIDKIGIPKINQGIRIASHGLVHVDHRLLGYAAQEMSIVVSCNLLNTRVFVPPFNKWNGDTEKICSDNGVQLIKFESGWLSIEHNKFNPSHDKWYLHSRAMSVDDFKRWFACE